MGAAFYIATEREIPDSIVDGKAIARVADELDARCLELGVRPLSDFISQDPAEAAGFLESEGMDPTGIDLPAEEWFAAGEGLATVRALLGHPDQLPKGESNLVEELREFEVVLAQLEKDGLRWHLAVDF